MNADAFRQLYDYHFRENRKIWDLYISRLSDEQFTQPVDYSHGSVRDQIAHLTRVDDAWFIPLRGLDFDDMPDPDDLTDRESLRAYAETVEQNIRDYLATLQDEELFEKPYPPGEDEDLILWQVLFHVVNHATDHRAQIMRAVSDMGIETYPQDFVFYAYENG